MTTADEETLEEYLHNTQLYINGTKNREDLTAFLDLIDSLPIPRMPQAEFVKISCHYEHSICQGKCQIF